MLKKSHILLFVTISELCIMCETILVKIKEPEVRRVLRVEECRERTSRKKI
jgi:hypothetical protein